MKANGTGGEMESSSSNQTALSKLDGSSAPMTRSKESSRLMAGEMLMLMSAKFGKELTGPEARSWREALEGQPSAAIEWAFKEYIRNPPADGGRKWFPEEYQILALLSRWHEAQRLDAEIREKYQGARDAERREAAGEKRYGLGDVLQMIREALKGKPSMKIAPVKVDKDGENVFEFTPEMRERARQQQEYILRKYGKTADKR